MKTLRKRMINSYKIYFLENECRETDMSDKQIIDELADKEIAEEILSEELFKKYLSKYNELYFSISLK